MNPHPEMPSDPISGGEQLLDRIREVARRITERVRHVTAGPNPDDPPAADGDESNSPYLFPPPQPG